MFSPQRLKVFLLEISPFFSFRNCSQETGKISTYLKFQSKGIFVKIYIRIIDDNFHQFTYAIRLLLGTVETAIKSRLQLTKSTAERFFDKIFLQFEIMSQNRKLTVLQGSNVSQINFAAKTMKVNVLQKALNRLG